MIPRVERVISVRLEGRRGLDSGSGGQRDAISEREICSRTRQSQEEVEGREKEKRRTLERSMLIFRRTGRPVIVVRLLLRRDGDVEGVGEDVDGGVALAVAG